MEDFCKCPGCLIEWHGMRIDRLRAQLHHLLLTGAPNVVLKSTREAIHNNRIKLIQAMLDDAGPDNDTFRYGGV